MKRCVWYISKYVAPPTEHGIGGRGYLLMREIARMGYESVIIASDSNQLAQVPRFDQAYLFQQVNGITFCWVHTLKYKAAKSIRRMLSWLDFEWRLLRVPNNRLVPPDVIVASSLSLLTIVSGLILRRRYKCRLIFEVRDIWPLTLTEEGGFSRINPFILALGFVERLGYKFADVIVGTMPNLGEHVAATLGYARPTYCIPMGVDTESISASELLPLTYEAEYIPRGKFLIAYAGTIGITNALGIFFECAEAMRTDNEVHFLVVGEGDLLTHFRSSYGWLPNLTFAPRVPKTMVHAVLTKCDLLYFSTYPCAVWKYGQSLNKVIDYMLAGRPIVASYTGFPSMINEAKCGSFVPAGDLASLQNEFRRYASMRAEDRALIGKRGREWLLDHRPYSRLAKDYLKLLFPDLTNPPAQNMLV